MTAIPACHSHVHVHYLVETRTETVAYKRSLQLNKLSQVEFFEAALDNLPQNMKGRRGGIAQHQQMPVHCFVIGVCMCFLLLEGSLCFLCRTLSRGYPKPE